jgi:hypothetical protein
MQKRLVLLMLFTLLLLFPAVSCAGVNGFSIDGKTWLGDSPQEAFIAISNRAVKKDAWKNNAKVDVYEFKLVKRICG